MEMNSDSRQRVIQIAVQLGVMSILTLLTVAAFTHIATLVLFRRLVIGKPRRAAAASAAGLESGENVETEFYVPVRSILNPSTATIDDDEEAERPTLLHRVGGLISRGLSIANDLPNSIRAGLIPNSGVTREVFVKRYQYSSNSGNDRVLILCNPSGETVESLKEKAVTLSKTIGFSSLVMFDYRPTGKSCKGVVAPDTTTMLEDAESVIQWLITVDGVDVERISVAGISLGGLQAIRLAKRYKAISRLVLINTFSSFSCLLKNTASLLPGALRIGATSAFLPDITRELHSLTTRKVAVISVECDERIPPQCTEEMLNAIRSGESSDLLHIVLPGTHSNPKVDYNSLEAVREFLDL